MKIFGLEIDLRKVKRAKSWEVVINLCGQKELNQI